MNIEMHVIYKHIRKSDSLNYLDFVTKLKKKLIKLNSKHSFKMLESNEIFTSLDIFKTLPSIDLHYDDENGEILSEQSSKIKSTRLIILNKLNIFILKGDNKLNSYFLNYVSGNFRNELILDNLKIDIWKVAETLRQEYSYEIKAIVLRNLKIFETKILTARLEVSSNSAAYSIIKKSEKLLVGLEFNIYHSPEYYSSLSIFPEEGVAKIKHVNIRTSDIDSLEEFLSEIVGVI